MVETALYIHGFASCGSSNKVELLRTHLGEDHLLSPDLPVPPDLAIALLSDMIERQPVSLLIGSSLGGFYAEYLSRHYALACVLINPATRPFDTLKQHTGTNTNWCSGHKFEWHADYNDQLAAMYQQHADSKQRYLVLLQTDDEILDYRLALNRYQQHEVVVERGGNHRFENLVDYLPVIDDYRRTYQQNS